MGDKGRKRQITPFRRRVATRILAVSFLTSLAVAVVAWYWARESTENAVVSLAIEESRQFMRFYGAVDLTSATGIAHAAQAAETIVGGIFDIIEVYDHRGHKVAEASTEEGKQIEPLLPKHQRPGDSKKLYESLTLKDGRWILRVFVPLVDTAGKKASPLVGYLEGVRVVPEWQSTRISYLSFGATLLAGVSALLCGALIYPIVVYLSAENERKTLEVLDSHISMMEALGRAIAKRDSDTGAHNYRVAWIAARIGERLGLQGGEMQSLIAGSFLHDVGKIGIPDGILLKPGRLDAAEIEIMRTHVQLGEEIVTGMGWLDGAREIVAAHHEKWDGSGYPRGLKGSAIPLGARIFAIADVFDALSSKRPYKESMPFEEVMRIMQQETGKHFDPDIMAVFVELADEIRTQLADGSEETARRLLEDCIRRHFAV